MLVTIDTLNSFNLTIEDDAAHSATIAAIVEKHERDYFDACMSVGLSDVFTEDTKDDERFLFIRNSQVIDDIRTKGLDYGVNHYIYYWYLGEAFNAQSQSGITVQNPENSVQVNPNIRLNELWDKAVLAQEDCYYCIDNGDYDYSEVTPTTRIGTRSSYNF